MLEWVGKLMYLANIFAEFVKRNINAVMLRVPLQQFMVKG